VPSPRFRVFRRKICLAVFVVPRCAGTVCYHGTPDFHGMSWEALEALKIPCAQETFTVMSIVVGFTYGVFTKMLLAIVSLGTQCIFIMRTTSLS
jgi:hypothetical protein